MEKQALPDALQGLTGGLSDVGHRLSDWYADIDPEVRKGLVRGLAGAAVAGGGIGTLRALTPRDPEASVSSHVLKPALLAALLGGGAAAGLPAGLHIMREGKPLGGGPASISGTLTNAVASPVTQFPGVALGGLVGAYPVLTKGMFGPKKTRNLTIADEMRRDLRSAMGSGWQQERAAINPALAAVQGRAPSMFAKPWSRVDSVRQALKTGIERATVTGQRATLFSRAGIRSLLAGAKLMNPGQLALLGLAIPGGMLAGRATERLIKG